MPTYAELSALNSKCDWTWTTQNDVNGYMVRGRGDYASASIFLPAAGDGYGTFLYHAGLDSRYWSSVPDSDSDYAWDLYFFYGYSGSYNTDIDRRYFGQSVRPVQGFAE